MENSIQIGVYKTLRKAGVQRNEIELDTPLMHHLFFDDQDWNCFLFLIESKFDISLNKKQEAKLHTVKNLIEFLQRNLN